MYKVLEIPIADIQRTYITSLIQLSPPLLAGRTHTTLSSKTFLMQNQRILFVLAGGLEDTHQPCHVILYISTFESFRTGNQIIFRYQERIVDGVSQHCSSLRI